MEEYEKSHRERPEDLPVDGLAADDMIPWGDYDGPRGLERLHSFSLL